jgi:hypothetical protein
VEILHFLHINLHSCTFIDLYVISPGLLTRRAVRRLKEVLKGEGIRIPIPEDDGPACGSKSFFEWRNYSFSPAIRVFGMIILETKGGADEAVLQVVLESENHDHRDCQYRNIPGVRLCRGAARSGPTVEMKIICISGYLCAG